MARLDLINNLIKLSDGKLFLLKQLLTLTEQQGKNIGSEEAEKLNKIIGQKQNIMDRVDALDKEFIGKYDLLKTKVPSGALEGLQAEDRDRMKVLQAKIQEIYSLTDKIHKLDLANVEKLKKNLKTVQDELERVRIGRKVIKGYADKSQEGVSIFLDERQ